MKKSLLMMVIGFMSLITMSCEDHFTYDKEKNFAPIGYEADWKEDEGMQESSTLLIKGIGGLVFDKIEKSDWKIITPSEIVFRGNQPLEISTEMMDVDDEDITNLETNYEPIMITFANTIVRYNYMGNDIILRPLKNLQFNIRLEEVTETKDKYYIQGGNIVFRLFVGYVPVMSHKIPFLVTDIEKENEEKK